MDLNELNNVIGSEVEKPKPRPEGHYTAKITGPYSTKKAKTGNLALVFPCVLVEAGSDVDQTALADAGGITGDQTFNQDFWMSADARYRFTDFAKAVGMNMEAPIPAIAAQLSEEKPLFTITVKHEIGDPDPNDPNGEPRTYVRYEYPTALTD